LSTVATTLAVITGASRGIGAGIAAAASRSGAVVAACNRSQSVYDRHLTVDLSDPAAWPVFAAWYDQLVDLHGPDRVVFVHSAATLTPIGFAGTVDPVAYRALVLLNSAAPQVLGDAAIRTARRTGRPTVIVQLSSGAAGGPYAGWSGYCSAKVAVEMWVETVAKEVAPEDDLVRVVAVRPGVVATDMQAEIRASESSAFPNAERFRQLHANGFLADPADVGSRIWSAALATDWVNGTVLDARQLA
jgi:benzil reductase ((S)-benzoin forming)